MNKKKIIAIFVIFLLIGTTLAATVSAKGLFGFKDGTSYRDLINKWEEIRQEKQELRDMLEEYGVELPDLTREQKREILKTIIQSRRQGAERNEILEIVFDLLIEFGMDLPDLTSEQFSEIREKTVTMLEENYGFVFIELTYEQKQEIRNTIKEMKRCGATKEEIKAAIIELYESYGGVIPELSDLEKEEIHNFIVNMLESDYGFDLPDLTLEQRETLKNKKSEIRELQKDLRQMFKNARFITKIRFLIYVRRSLN